MADPVELAPSILGGTILILALYVYALGPVREKFHLEDEISVGRALVYAPYIFAPRVWGLSPATDQQLGGLLMWVPVSLYMIVIMSVLFIRWMQQQEREPREEESMWEAIPQPDQEKPLPRTHLPA